MLTFVAPLSKESERETAVPTGDAGAVNVMSPLPACAPAICVDDPQYMMNADDGVPPMYGGYGDVQQPPLRKRPERVTREPP